MIELVVSKYFNDLHDQLLHEDPSTRLSAKEALAHPWITNGSEEPEDGTYSTGIFTIYILTSFYHSHLDPESSCLP